MKVFVANAHMLTEAYRHLELSLVLKNADLVTPDGIPLVWMMRLMGTCSKPRGGDGYSFIFVSASSTAKCVFLVLRANILEK